ncbi:hypothetical protein [Bradyrhizobium monzae]|uniref:hypothetical protein n=1 Tax=Bradyrhizobium sp. Oc8 TaxID=2876780 RepID=UPI001F292C43|nr:hypothetical protein [Bradyrhizobium sp. Oc8]
MFFVRPNGLAGLLLACALLASLQEAGAFELSGAWSSDAELCDRVFTREGDKVIFAELSDLYGSGFVINGDRIIGKAAHCTIESTKQNNDSLELSAACASSIMNQNVKFSLKIIDDNTIDRTIEEIPGMTLKYSRCKI